MIKKVLGVAVITAMVACGNGKEGDANTVESITHESHEGHDHEGHDHESHEGHDHGTEATDNNDRLEVAEGAKVFFVNLKDGDVVTSPVVVEMGVEGMAVEPAGKAIAGTGHHHILINNTEGYLVAGAVVPADENNIHFGAGETETELELAPGNYTITLQFANGFHESYGQQMSTSVNITVE